MTVLTAPNGTKEDIIVKLNAVEYFDTESPFDIATLKRMVLAGRFVASSLVWKAGMTEWAKANSIQELAPIFSKIPLVLPI